MTSLGDKGEGYRETTALLGNEDEGSVQTQTKVLNQGSWTQVSCPCCVSEQVEPLVLIQLSDNIQPVTKRWLISLIEMSERDGGAALLAHPGEDECGDVIVVSAPRCTLLRATEDLGLCKKYHNEDMVAFSYNDRDNFSNVDDMQEFLTLAERQYIVKYELDFLRAQKGQKIPGVPESQGVLKARENICQKLEKAGVIKDIFPLHDKQRLTDLCRNWYSGKQIWGQPLDSIQAYFGGTVGFYFSFLDFYTWALVPPAILGLVLTFLLPRGGSGAGVVKEQAGEGVMEGVVEVDDSPSVSGHMVQAVFSMLWSTLVMEFWKRRSSSLSHRWGLLHLAERFAEPRPGFHGTLGINPVTGRLEPLFPEWQRQLRVGLVSVPLVGFFLGMVVLGMTGFYHGEALAQGFHQDSGSLFSGALLYLPSVAHIVYTNMLGNVYRTVAMQLTEWENHREESSFQNHHTTKVLLFTFFNYFAVLFHIAFYKQDLPLLRKRLASLLIVTQLVNQCTEVVVPFIVDRFFSAPQKKQQEDDPDVDKLRAQRSLPPFPGLFAEYIELLVQFGYLSLFSCVYPLTAVLLLLNNITEIRADAYKICKLFRKPFSAPVSNIGVWQTAFEVLGFVSVMSNCWLLLLSPRVREFCLEGGISGRNIILFAILIEHVLILVKMILAFMIPDEPDWVRIKREQIEFHSMQALGQQKL
ncbi:anoctamin-10-like [Salvelinus fontinalis]|uniref:anoctamin-10-like n=1 Tax=Salvelinus fontinalis TaxID=8038 RepID=UPI002485CAA7|nr:anoctamin-10-like [Salvelinus fontinalis]XP_055796385.1 anoctamin-10-like [Salvelinus fontinalis]XP_055796386.1 anoctamin-10-like [Salvelinus fontinalis]